MFELSQWGEGNGIFVYVMGVATHTMQIAGTPSITCIIPILSFHKTDTD